MSNKSVLVSIVWKFIERCSVLGCQFVIQIIMARLISPKEYGVMSIMIIFTTVAQVLIQTGLSNSVVQVKVLDDRKLSSVFWLNAIFSIVLFAALLVLGPWIEKYFDFNGFTIQFWVLILIVPIAAIGAIHMAILMRHMEFRRIMICSLISVIIGGFFGILLALKGFGVWALVIQQLAYYLTNSVCMCIATKWVPKFVLSIGEAADMLNFGWRILAGNLVETIYDNIVSFVIGKKYSPSVLAFYNRGKQFPNMAASVVKEALQSVLISSYSKKQDDLISIRDTMRVHVRLSQFAVCFVLTVLAFISDPLIELMLTSKWGPCVPYLKVSCIFYMFIPINTIELQGINAIGRSDISLQIGVTKRLVSIIIVLGACFASKSVFIVACVWTCTGLINLVLNAKPINEIFHYSFASQLKDFLPYVVVGGLTILFESFIPIMNNLIVSLIVRAIISSAFYLGFCFILRFNGALETKQMVCNVIKQKICKS